MRARVDFSDPYYRTPARFVARRDAKAEGRLEALEGKKVGAVAGTAHEAYLKALFTEAVVQPFPTAEAARAALRGALSDRARYGRVHVVDHIIEGDTPKTKTALTALRSVTEAKRVLLVLDREDELTWKSLRNEPSVHVLVSDQLNTYDVLVNDDVVFTQKAYDEFISRAAKK